MTQAERADIIARAQEGHRPAVIAAQMGLTGRRVNGVLSNARRRGVTLPRFPTGPVREQMLVRRALIAAEIAEGLKAQAAVRGMTASELAGELIRNIIRDDLVDAVLDDGGDRG